VIPVHLKSSRRPPVGTALVLAPLLFASCKSYNDRIQHVVADYEAGRFEVAAETFQSGEFDEAFASDIDGMLFLLEAGKVLQDAGRYPESSAMFDRAYEIMVKWDLEADVSVSDEVTAMVGTQTSLPYRGSDYDRILLDVYEVLNYLARDDFGEAMVHVRRAYRRQAEAVARNQEEIQRRQEDGESKETFESEAYKELEQQVDSLTTDAYADFVNPMATFLSAVLLREEGTNSNAVVDLRKLAGMIPDNGYLEPLLAEFEANAAPVPGRFYVVFENGLAPVREEWSMTVPSPVGLTRIAVPTLRPVARAARGLRVASADGALVLETELVASIDSIVATDFKLNLPSRIWRIILSQAVKEGSTAVLSNQVNDSTARAFLEIGASIFKIASSGADLRTWRTPGSEFQIAYGQVPADGHLRLTLLGVDGRSSAPIDVLLPPARTTFLYVRNPRFSEIQPRVFTLGPASLD